MSTLPVTTVIERAQATLHDGRYREAMRLCQALLREFPKYLTAHRLLGQAALYAGETELAEEALQTVRQLDPEDREAALGLSQIAEQRGELEIALAFCQAAWECSPWDQELRERVARLAEACYGEGQLFLTGAALAAQHCRGGRWTRAANECRAVLNQTATRPDVQQRLAVALWRRGDLEAAAEVCRSVLQVLPDAVVPLLVLAQIEQERGETGEAAALRERAHRIDLDGRRAATLALAGQEELRAFLLPAGIPQVEEAVLAGEAAVGQAAAPGGTAPEVRAAEIEREEVLLELPSDEELEAARPGEAATAGYTSLLRSLEGEGLEPFSPEEGSAEVPAAVPEEVLLQLPSDEEIEAARPREELEPGWTGLLESYELEGVEPFTPEVFASGEVVVETGAGPEQAGEREGAEEAVSPAGELPAGLGTFEETGSWLEHAVIDSERAPGAGRAESPAFGEEWYGEELAPQAFEELGEPMAAGAGQAEEATLGPGEPVLADQIDEREALAAAAERLGVGPELFERSRAAKEELVATGRLGQHPSKGEPEVVTRAVGEPGDRLAEARRLLEAGRVEEAMACYRALYRAGREFDDALIAVLTPIADAGGPGAAEADRILGAIYRRRGTQALAARHYERSLRRK
jgi:tetratricopeptide (TPR) repeat protein